MVRRNCAVFALALGAGFDRLFLLDVGLAHPPGDAGAALTVAVIALAVVLTWHGLGWLEKWGKRGQERGQEWQR